MKNCLTVSISFIVCFLLIISCSSPKSNHLNVGISNFPVSINPIYVSDETGTLICNKVFDSLYEFSNLKGIRSHLVKHEKLKVLKNGKLSIFIQLNNDVRFSNGSPVTSDDIIATVKLTKDPKYNSPYRFQMAIIEKAVKHSPNKIEFILKKNAANWKLYFQFKILNENQIRNITPETIHSQVFIGTGPLKIEKMSKPSKISMVVNPYYKTKMGLKYKGVTFRVLSYPHNGPLKLLKGELDICELQPEAVREYKHVKDWKSAFDIHRFHKFGFSYLGFNLESKSITTDLRKLLYQILHHRGFVESFIKERGINVYSPFLMLNGKPEYNDISTELLPKKIEMLTNSESKLRTSFVLFLKSALKEWGIEIVPVFTEYHTFIDKLKRRDYETVVSGFILDPDYDLTDVLSSQGYVNYFNFKSEKVDKLLHAGLTEYDSTKRGQIYRQIEDIWAASLPFIPLFKLNYHYGVSKQILTPDILPEIVVSSEDYLKNILEWLK